MFRFLMLCRIRIWEEIWGVSGIVGWGLISSSSGVDVLNCEGFCRLVNFGLYLCDECRLGVLILFRCFVVLLFGFVN